ncbi:MAG TPA: hypothetical protein VK453_26980 [Micromonosporaceae bacterium]|nr:hypothetical protein [Micromonosporaceae bacterium]
MGNSHTPADDLFYDLVSIQYHALKGAQAYEQYKQDAQGHDDVVEFIEQVQREDAARAVRAHELLGQLTKESGGGLG